MTDLKKQDAENSIEGTTYIVIAISSLILFLSGGCTLVFLGDGTAVEFALVFGAIGIVPSGLLLFAALRRRKVGPNLTSGIIGAVNSIALLVCSVIFVSNQFFLGATIFLMPMAILIGFWSASNFVRNN